MTVSLVKNRNVIWGSLAALRDDRFFFSGGREAGAFRMSSY